MSMIMNDDWGESDSERQVRLGCEKKIESLQAEIRRKSQAIASLEKSNALDQATIQSIRDTKDARIKDLEQQLAKKDQELDALRKSWFDENQARELAEAEMRGEAKARMECEKYIGRLETAYMDEVKARRKGKSGSPILEAMSALEKLKG